MGLFVFQNFSSNLFIMYMDISMFTDSQFDLSTIPKIFLIPNLDLSRRENFDEVFAFSKNGLLGEGKQIVMNVKQMQEKV